MAPDAAISSRTEPGAAVPREFLTIQALRFVAALAVVTMHSTYYTRERLDPHGLVYPGGANGVQLFFVISGFVMIMSSEKLLNTAGGWHSFALKRINRIVPLYWGVLCFKLATTLASPAMVLHAKLDWAYIVKSFLFIPAMNSEGHIFPFLGVGWTLNFEMFFYALFSAALFLRVRPILFIAPILVGLAAVSFLRTPAWPAPLYFLSDMIVLDFLTGMLIAHWCRRGGRLPAALAWLLMAVGLVYLFGPGARLDFYSLAGELAVTSAASAVIIAAISLEARIGPVIPPWVQFFGGASYSLYLIHPILVPAVPNLLHRIGWIVPAASVGLSIMVALAAASLCYRFVEQPITRMLTRRTRVTSRPSRESSGAVALSPAGAGSGVPPRQDG